MYCDSQKQSDFKTRSFDRYQSFLSILIQVPVQVWRYLEMSRRTFWYTYFILHGRQTTKILYSDPYHTYLSIAALCMYPPSHLSAEEKPESWKFPILDPLLNARMETAEWAKKYISVKGQ